MSKPPPNQFPQPPKIDPNQSPFERRAYAYIERGYSVIPIAPGSKRPGRWSEADGWRGMHDWEKYGKERMPTEIELEHWYTWPGAGIGLLTGKLSQVIGLDRDYDTTGTDALDKLIPFTPVKKKGAKGYTAFFRYNGERSCSFNIGGKRVLDVLSDGRQTLMPGTVHPDGHVYVYLTDGCLEELDSKDLPALPDDFLAQVERTIAPYQDEEDKRYAKKNIALPADNNPINTELSIKAQYYRDLNSQALRSLDDWVPKLIPLSKSERGSWRTVATWRNAKDRNVGIHPTGVFDWGGNYGMTPIDLVMYANGMTFEKACEALKSCVKMHEHHIQMTVGGSAAPMRPAADAPVLMPWQKPAAAIAAPPAVMLPPDTSIAPAPAIPAFLVSPPGILGDITRYINSTAPKFQPELALAAAIALCSTIMGRSYRTQTNNWTSLYLIMIARSTEGKEHPQACVENILSLAGFGNMIGGSGYTSAGAVYSALLKSPCHLVTIDEMGKLLKISRAKGMAHQEAALDKLVEAFGRLNGIMRPVTYSDMTMKEKTKTPLVHNPAITLLGATTPGTFYAALTSDLVQDGFLGRCIIVESKQPRQLTRFVTRADPPEKILTWCKEVHPSGALGGDLAGVMVPDMPANPIELPFDEACINMLKTLEQELNDEKTAAEGDSLDVLLGRTQEKAMRLSMIVAKAEDSRNRVIQPHHLQWAIDYVMYYDLAMVRAVREERTENLFDADLKKLRNFVANAKQYKEDAKWGATLAKGVMPHSKLLKLMKCSAKQLAELVDVAVETGIVNKSPGAAFGCAAEVYLPGK